jgi:hypothetical protein
MRCLSARASGRKSWAHADVTIVSRVDGLIAIVLGRYRQDRTGTPIQPRLYLRIKGVAVNDHSFPFVCIFCFIELTFPDVLGFRWTIG